MSIETLAQISGALALVGMMAYAILGGADFGGGIWDLFATGQRKDQQRQAIAKAMGPVWEANHVWLIFVVVVLFTCFPKGFVALATALFIPLHVAIVGIMLRGAAFVFRGVMQSPAKTSQGASLRTWGLVFGISSIITPVLMGAVFGAVTAGDVKSTLLPQVQLPFYLRPYPLACGLLALSTCAYLAAVYLTVETAGQLREDFRRRAIISGTTTAVLAFVVLLVSAWEANWFFKQMLSPRSWPVLLAGLFFFAASAWAVLGRRYLLSRVFAAGEIILLILGWGLAQQPYLVYPDFQLVQSAGPAATIQFLLMALPFGAIILVPSLWLLFKVFKTQPKMS
jgi:cytochrome d ubiquinol oxidase subunit II